MLVCFINKFKLLRFGIHSTVLYHVDLLQQHNVQKECTDKKMNRYISEIVTC